MDKSETLREITEITSMQETAIHGHNAKLVSVYENARDVIKSGQHVSWDTEDGKTAPLNDIEINQISSYITSSSFISAWYHLAGEKQNRDKAAHSCATLISSLDPDSQEVMRKYIETEQLWRRTIKKYGAASSNYMLIIFAIVAFITVAFLVISL